MKMRFSGQLALVIVVLGLGWEVPAQGQTFSVLYDLGTNTGDPYSPNYSGIVAQGRDGRMFSTALGGSTGAGAMFKITPGGTLVPYSFDSTNSGPYLPYSGLTLGADGNFYGTTNAGGASGMGTVFKIMPSGTVTVLHSFAGGSDGGYPWAPPIQGTDGNFYGTTCANLPDCGTVYKITPSGKFRTLYLFDYTHGYCPVAPLVQGTDGNFYGTTTEGGSSFSFGVVYKITPSGKFTVIYKFNGGDGSQPFGPLVQGSDGNFYGTTSVGAPRKVEWSSRSPRLAILPSSITSMGLPMDSAPLPV